MGLNDFYNAYLYLVLLHRICRKYNFDLSFILNLLYKNYFFMGEYANIKITKKISKKTRDLILYGLILSYLRNKILVIKKN